MKTIRLEILGEPFSKQSFRYAVINGRVHKYQPKKIVNAQVYFKQTVASQLPENFHIFDTYVVVKELIFVFHPPKSFSKKKLKAIQSGEIIYKRTKPDLTDNLMKGVFDSLQGIVFTNDARVCELNSVKKIYGINPKTIIVLEGE